MSATKLEHDINFDYRELRLMVGLIAFLLPVAVYLITFKISPSISAYYHSNARDVFVGLMFVIGALLVAYKGHNKTEEWISSFGGVTAIVTALFPTSCDNKLFPSACTADLVPTICSSCGVTQNVTVHTIGAFLTFSVIVYFCLIAFLRRVFEKIDEDTKPTVSLVLNHALKRGKKDYSKYKMQIRRLRIYLVCGLLMAVILLISVYISFTNEASVILFWGESFALFLFGIAWMTASKFWFFGDDDEKKGQA